MMRNLAKEWKPNFIIETTFSLLAMPNVRAFHASQPLMLPAACNNSCITV